MRQFLITKFVCSACGKNLSIHSAPKNAGEYAEGQPTGADMVEQMVAVEPCTCCTKPLEEVRTAGRKSLIQLPGSRRNNNGRLVEVGRQEDNYAWM